MSKALDMCLDDFREFNKEHNPAYQEALKRDNFKLVLPSFDEIYFKDYHFLDEPLINRKN